MWKVQKWMDGGQVVLAISGRIDECQLAQLEEALVSEGRNDRVVVDLKDVKLVDQACVAFLASREAGGWTLCNCPAYIREWINQERRMR